MMDMVLSLRVTMVDMTRVEMVAMDTTRDNTAAATMLLATMTDTERRRTRMARRRTRIRSLIRAA